MILELTSEQKLVQEQGKRFAENEIKPFVEQEEEHHAFNLDRVKKMADLGF
ncbi:MAG: acyl-CoA dehydrogenase family protein, partial [Deltaproteobacteria bacterium]|nr:acyl-CoA dehydrogenase family protein [Deltaproteobacteria bacterium]